MRVVAYRSAARADPNPNRTQTVFEYTRLIAIVLLASSVSMPAVADGLTHVVSSGDFLGRIAESYGVTVRELREWNQLTDDRIIPGQELRVMLGGSDGDGYEVRPGDTLLGIALAHEVSVEDIVSWNPGLNPNRIRVGQRIALRTAGRPTRTVMYEVERGDFLGKIAEHHGVRIADIQGWNPGLDADRIRVGQEIRLVLRGPEVPSESIGRAFEGRLVNGEQLPPHRAYSIRNLQRAWGTNETIGALVDGFEHMRREFDRLPVLPVHDLSVRDGGPISDHRSHQSGRDADLGYYHSGCRQSCPYRTFTPSDLDVERQWALLSFWFERDLVEYIFMDYEYQEVLYKWLRDERGASASQLSEWFQYPRGRDTAAGLIRHERNHADHLHVRFACNATDERCR